jgi:chromate transporter
MSRSARLKELAWLFLKLGTIGFGGPAAHIAMMEDEVVRRRGWLLHEKFVDLVGATNLIPGPNSTEMAIYIGHSRAGIPGLLVAGACFILPATLIGYVLRGAPGAVVAIVGIFLPAFFFVAISGPLVPRIRRSPLAGAFFNGVNVASLALMAVVTWRLGAVALVDWLTLSLAVILAVLLFRFKLNSAWLVAIGALAGLIQPLAH